MQSAVVRSYTVYIFIAVSLLKSAKFLFRRKKTNMYMKDGGVEKALYDFRSLNPQNVKQVGVSAFGTCILVIRLTSYDFGPMIFCQTSAVRRSSWNHTNYQCTHSSKSVDPRNRRLGGTGYGKAIWC